MFFAVPGSSMLAYLITHFGGETITDSATIFWVAAAISFVNIILLYFLDEDPINNDNPYQRGDRDKVNLTFSEVPRQSQHGWSQTGRRWKAAGRRGASSQHDDGGPRIVHGRLFGGRNQTNGRERECHFTQEKHPTIQQTND